MKLGRYAAAAAIGALCAAPAMAADKTLTISVYAFAQDEFKELVYDPFEEICDCELVVETGNSVERMSKIEANKDAAANGAATKDIVAPGHTIEQRL